MDKLDYKYLKDELTLNELSELRKKNKCNVGC